MASRPRTSKKTLATLPTWRVVANDVILVTPEDALANVSGPVLTMYQRKSKAPNADRMTFDFVIFGPMQEAEKIVVCMLEKDEAGLTAMYIKKNLLGSVTFRGIHCLQELENANYRSFSVVKGRGDVCQMEVSFEYSTAKMTKGENKRKEHLLVVKIHTSETRITFSHLFKVFDSRYHASKSFKHNGESKDVCRVEFHIDKSADTEQFPLNEPSKQSSMSAATSVEVDSPDTSFTSEAESTLVTEPDSTQSMTSDSSFDLLNMSDGEQVNIGMLKKFAKGFGKALKEELDVRDERVEEVENKLNERDEGLRGATEGLRGATDRNYAMLVDLKAKQEKDKTDIVAGIGSLSNQLKQFMSHGGNAGKRHDKVVAKCKREATIKHKDEVVDAVNIGKNLKASDNAGKRQDNVHDKVVAKCKREAAIKHKDEVAAAVNFGKNLKARDERRKK